MAIRCAAMAGALILLTLDARDPQRGGELKVGASTEADVRDRFRQPGCARARESPINGIRIRLSMKRGRRILMVQTGMAGLARWPCRVRMERTQQ